MIRRVALFVALAALVASAGYVLVYLYRWEWHRALVAGVFMISLEVGIAFVFLLERLRRLEAKLVVPERRDVGETHEARDVLRETAPELTEPFAWLTEASNRMSVFVPLLLGAGVVLSALAWAVERVARATASPTLERALAVRLQPLTMPAGTLTGGASRTLPPSPSTARSRTWLPLLLAGSIVPILLLGQGLDRLADATQNRPDVLAPDSAGRIVLDVEWRDRPELDPTVGATSLWAACTQQVGTTYRLTGVTRIDGGRVELLVRPAVGKYAERRLRGCLEDGVVDAVQAEVLEVSPR